MRSIIQIIRIITVVLFAGLPIIVKAQTPYVIGSYADRQTANTADLYGNFVSSVSDISENSNVILLGDIFTAPDHYPLYELQKRGCKVIRLEGRDQDDFIARIKAYNDYTQSGNNVFSDIPEGMANITHPVLFPLLKSVELKQPNKQNTNLDFVPKPLFNTPPSPEPEYVPPALADFAKTGRIILNIVFEPNSVTIPASAIPILREVAMMLRFNKSMNITVEGHTDKFQSTSHNLNLSIQRANSVKNWLVRSGADSGQVRAVGYGETRPIADNDTPEGREKNRRVEIVKD